MESTNTARYCGVVFNNVGSSWGWDVTPTAAAQRAAAIYRRDWKPQPGTPLVVNVLDMDEHAGWYLGDTGAFRDTETDAKIPVKERITVTA
jgi:hypothetical protein